MCVAAAWPRAGLLCRCQRTVAVTVTILITATGHHTTSRESTFTEENGSGWAAQRLGGRLDVWCLMETAERVPIASTPVPSRSPVTQLILR